MNTRKTLSAAVCAGIVFSFASCSGLFEETEMSQAVTSGSYFEVSPSITNLTLTGLNANDIYMFQYNTTDENIGASSTDYVTGITDSGGSSITQLSVGIPEDEELFDRSAVDELMNDGTEISAVFGNGFIRTENRKAHECPQLIKKTDRSVSDALPVVYKSYSTGATTTFFVENKSGAHIIIPVTLRATGDHCYVWIADANYTTASSTNSDELITASQASAIASNFDMIYPKETAVFGDVYDGTSKYTNIISPADKISILVYDIDYDYSASLTGGTYGFFAPDDFTTNRTYSNQNEMFYIDAYFLDKVAAQVYSTLAHEFQHMLNFVNKNLNGITYETWYTEMLSMVCEDIMQKTLGISDSDSPKGRLTYYLYGGYGAGHSVWRDSPTIRTSLSGSYSLLDSYASAYAFGAYIMRNYGGVDLISYIAQNSYADGESITQALKEENTDETYDSVCLKEGQVLVYNTTTGSKPSLNKTVSFSIDTDGGTWASSVTGTDVTTYKAGTTALPYFFPSGESGQHEIDAHGYIASKVCKNVSDEITINLSGGNENEKIFILVK